MNFLILLWALMLKPQEQTQDEIKRIIVVKFPALSAETPADIHCGDITTQNTFLDSFTIKSNYINEFVEKNIAGSHSIVLQYGIDARAKVLVVYRSGKVDELCLTDGSSYFLNGKPMRFPNDNFITWIRSFELPLYPEQ